MMSTHSEEDRFAAALHQAAGVLPAPSPQELYQGSLRRGHAIAEVALDAGFADQAHFQRTFKQLLAATPGHYRGALDARGAGDSGQSPDAGDAAALRAACDVPQSRAA